MKYGLNTFTLTDQLISAFQEKYHHSTMFITINGCLRDSYYKPYRDIQKHILKQILSSLDIEYSPKNVSINMDLSYSQDGLQIDFNSWIPQIEIEYEHPQYGHRYYVVRLNDIMLSKHFELLVY